MNLNNLDFLRLANLGLAKSAGLFCALSALFLAPVSIAEEIQLQWDPNSEPDLAGYRLYCGSQSSLHSEVMDVGNQTQHTLELAHDWDTYYFVVTAYNVFGLESDPSNEISYSPASMEVAASVQGRRVFYNRSAWDGNDPAANAQDDLAVAPDKSALLPGHSASFAHYTSYSRGINGVMIDIANLAGAPTLQDFEFRTGKSGGPSGWSAASDPLGVWVRPGEGDGGSDRITLLWADNNLDSIPDANEAVAGAWLEVRIKATANTGLNSDDFFYFGNAIGDTGNNPGEARVSTADVLQIRDNPRTLLDPALIDDLHDINRDGKVNTQDLLLARNHKTTFLDELALIDLGGLAPSSFQPVDPAQLRATSSPWAVAMGWMEGQSILTFSGPAGAEYQIHASERINGGWQLLAESVVEIAPGRFQLKHPVPAGQNRFYNIVPVLFEENDVFPSF